MSQQVQQAPAGQHSHAHPRPPQPAQQVMPPPQPDPVMQARIDADFKPVDIAVGGPSTAFAFCNTHKVEKCKQCNVDFTALNRVSKILVTNPTLRCPPPPTVVQQKLSQAVTNMKDEGNNLYKLNKTREALSKYNMAASIAVQRPAWESATILREELSTVVSNRSAALLELGDYLGALVDAETVISASLLSQLPSSSEPECTMSGTGGFTPPQQPPQQQPQPYSPPSGGQIAPGSITYTTSTSADGQVTYHPFRAVPASYQTAQGVVHGIQWVPAEATQILPTGAQPANAEFAASFNRGQLSREEERELDNWKRSEEKRKKKEEKASLKNIAKQFERDEIEIRMARERDTQVRERKRSFYGEAPPSGYQIPGTAAYGAYNSSTDLDRRFGDLDVGRKEVSFAARPRKLSQSGAGAYASPPATYSSPTGYPTTGSASPYNRAASPYRPVGNFSTSPNIRPQEFPSTYPGGPDPMARAPSPYGARAPSPFGATAPSPYGARAPSPYGARAPSPYGARAPSPYGARAPSPYGARAPSPFGATAPTPYGARAPSPYGARAPSPYGGPATSSYVARAPSPMPQGPRGASPMPPGPRAPSPYARPVSRAPSPYHGQQATSTYPPPHRAPSPFVPPGQIHSVYPRGHVLEGQPIAAPRSRAPSPMPGAPAGPGFPSSPRMPNAGFSSSPRMPNAGFTSSPRMPNTGFPSSPRMPGAATGGESLQLAAPEAFSRPPNAAQPYTPFSVMRIQDMDKFYDQIPRMPLVLDTHDVYHQDWIRFMNDLALAWAGKMPIHEFSKGGVPPKRSSLVADLINLWNDSFFRARRVEVVLYKGRERRSGPHTGTLDKNLPMPDLDSGSDSSDSSSSLSSESEDEYYGRGVDLADSKRRRREKKEEKKWRKKEKKLRKKVKERERQYALYLNYIAPRDMPVPGNYYG